MSLLRRPFLLVAAVSALVAVAACSPQDEPSAAAPAGSASASACAKADLNLVSSGKLTVGTDSPAFEPWFADNKPANGKGFESAVAYAVAGKLGFAQSEVSWTTVPFNSSFAPGRKKSTSTSTRSRSPRPGRRRSTSAPATSPSARP